MMQIFASLLLAVLVEPSACVEHQKLCIVVVTWIVAVIVAKVVVVLCVDVFF